LFLGISKATTATSVAIIGKALFELLEASEAKLPGNDVGKDSICAEFLTVKPKKGILDWQVPILF
jgi:hypothetical protein